MKSSKYIPKKGSEYTKSMVLTPLLKTIAPLRIFRSKTSRIPHKKASCKLYKHTLIIDQNFDYTLIPLYSNVIMVFFTHPENFRTRNQGGGSWEY